MKNITEIIENEEFLDPKIDFTFKNIFGHDKTNFMNLTNAILNLKAEKKIVDVTFLNLELAKDSIENRDARLDVLAELQDKTLVNIEMQCANYKDFEKRSLYYFSKIYSNQLKKKDRFHDLKPVIVINLLNFVLFADEEDFHCPLIISNSNNHKRHCHDFETHFIEIPKLNKSCYDLDITPLEQWVLFLKNPQKQHLKELAMRNEDIAKAYESLELLNHDPKSRALYESRKAMLMDIDNGMAVNRLEGKIEGMIEGEIKGKIEAKMEVAQKLLKMNMPIKEISKATGLSEEEIQKLQ